MNNSVKTIFLFILLAVPIAVAAEKIVELKFDHKTGDLHYPNTPRVGLLGGVKWIIKDHKEIKSFMIVEKPGNHRYIFTKPLPKAFDTLLHMKLNTPGKEFEWEYGIKWRDSNGKERYFDPKIAVKPLIPLAELILLLAFLTTLITSIVFFRLWQKAKNDVRNS